MVAPGAPGVADLAHDGVLVGGVGVGQIGQRGEGGVELFLHLVELALELLLAAPELAHRRDRGRGVAARALGLRDLLRGPVLARAQLLELEHTVQSARGVATRERRPRGLGIGADRAQVEHAREPSRAPPGAAGRPGETAGARWA